MNEIPENIAINEGVVEEEEGLNGEDLMVDGEDDEGNAKKDDIDIDDLWKSVKNISNLVINYLW